MTPRPEGVAGAPVLCFGEALWDVLPAGHFPGGAPLNVAYHLARCGARALPVSAVGDDAPGREMLGWMRGCGLEPRFVPVLPGASTGLARAEVGPDGAARYTFGAEAAWDHVPVPPALLDVARGSAALVFGTLALRGPHNRGALAALAGAAGAACKVLDVNLRPPHADPDLVWRLAPTADILKVNDGELRALTGAPPGPAEPATLERFARDLRERAGCARVCVTAGGSGAGLLWGGVWHWRPARAVRVADTVGAGDAFLARLVHALLAERLAPAQALDLGCKVGEFVASRPGSTPAYRLLPNGEPVDA